MLRINISFPGPYQFPSIHQASGIKQDRTSHPESQYDFTEMRETRFASEIARLSLSFLGQYDFEGESLSLSSVSQNIGCRACNN